MIEMPLKYEDESVVESHESVEISREELVETPTTVAPLPSDTPTDETDIPIEEYPCREHRFIDDDVTLANNLTVGGELRAALFLHPYGARYYTLEMLKKEHPHPRVGMWAIVGGPTEFDVYCCRIEDRWEKCMSQTYNIDEVKRFVKGFEIGEYESGLSGAKIDSEGNAELNSLIVRLKALLGELEVKGNSAFHGNVSSEDFVSGFMTGKGWGITRKKVLNALGIAEDKYTAEFDEVVVRGALRIFSLIASQLLGENDNRVFTAMAEVDHYDPSTGKIWIDTKGGKSYNPFRAGDYIMVQQYNGAADAEGYITKHYELIVTAAGSGDMTAGEERLDWVQFEGFISVGGLNAESLIYKGDTLTRVDSATDADRKGLIQIMTVGSCTPYMDIAYGLKTDPDNALKGRLGNLAGLRHHLFGWLEGFGELLTNLYAVGDFRLRRTGESLDSKIEMLRGVFESRFRALEYRLTEDDNYLYNATFTELMTGWAVSDTEGEIITSNGEALLMNGNTYIADGRIAEIEEYEGRGMLHLKNNSIRQYREYIKDPGKHTELNPDRTSIEKWDTLYLCVKILPLTGGRLTIGFETEDSDPGGLPGPVTVELESSLEWQTLKWSGTWNGTGDFILGYSGDAYISLLSVTSNPLDDYKKEVSTSIEQTSDRISLLGKNVDKINGTVTDLGVEINAANETISIYTKKTDSIEGTVTNLGITLDAQDKQIRLYAEQITATEKSLADLKITADEISSTVTSLKGELETAKSSITQTANNITALVTRITDAESKIGGIERSQLQIESNYTSLSSQFVALDGRVLAKADISTSVQYDPKTGFVTSKIKLTADQIDLRGTTIINSEFRVDTDGTTHIGEFVIDSNGLHNSHDTYNKAWIYPGKIQLLRCYTYAGSEYARIDCRIGDGSNPMMDNPGLTEGDRAMLEGTIAAYFYRRMSSTAAGKYAPAVYVKSDNNFTSNVGLQVDGAVRVNGGLIECGNMMTLGNNATNIIDISFGTTIVVSSTVSNNAGLYLPKRQELLSQTGHTSTDYFAVPIKIICSKDSSHQFLVCTQDKAPSSTVSSSDAGMITGNNGGELSGSKVLMDKGDTLDLALIYLGGTYYIQRTSYLN